MMASNFVFFIFCLFYSILSWFFCQRERERKREGGEKVWSWKGQEAGGYEGDEERKIIMRKYMKKPLLSIKVH